MSGDVDDVVRATHDPKVAVFILEPGIGGLVITRIRIEIRLDILSIFVPKRRQTSGRQRQLDYDVANLVISHLQTFIVEHANVVARNRFATRAGSDRQRLEANAIRADGPSSLRLPPVIYHGHAELSLRPRQRIRIATLASQKQRAEVF